VIKPWAHHYQVMFKVGKGLCCGECDLLGGSGPNLEKLSSGCWPGLRPREMSLEKNQQMRLGKVESTEPSWARAASNFPFCSYTLDSEI
jgi:hypothetical protein